MARYANQLTTITSRLSSRFLERAGSFGIAAIAALAMAIAATPAQAVSLIGPGTAPKAKDAVKLTTEVQHRGGGGFRGGGGGGGFRGGGFRGGGPAFGGGGFRGGGPAFRGGGFPGGGPAFRGGGFRYAGAPIYRNPGYAPVRHYGYQRRFVRPRAYGYAPIHYGRRYVQPRRFCHTVWTYYGPTRICRPPYYAGFYPGLRFNAYW